MIVGLRGCHMTKINTKCVTSAKLTEGRKWMSTKIPSATYFAPWHDRCFLLFSKDIFATDMPVRLKHHEKCQCQTTAQGYPKHTFVSLCVLRWCVSICACSRQPSLYSFYVLLQCLLCNLTNLSFVRKRCALFTNDAMSEYDRYTLVWLLLC